MFIINRWFVMALDNTGNLDKEGNLYEFRAHNPIKHMKYALTRYYNVFPHGYAFALFENRFDDNKFIKVLKVKKGAL